MLAQQFEAVHLGFDTAPAVSPLHRRKSARPRRLDAPRASLRATAPAAMPSRTAPSSSGRSGLPHRLGALSPPPARRQCCPGHAGVKPDRQRPAAPRRRVGLGPVQPRAGRCVRSAFALQLSRWIHDMNPSRIYATEPRRCATGPK
jgi:hypothetical protein